MDEPREIVDVQQVELALAIASALGVVAGLGLCAVVRKSSSPVARKAAVFAAAGALLWPLWQVYNAIENRFGLDSVAALLINLGLFIAVGVASGFLVRKFWPPNPHTN